MTRSAGNEATALAPEGQGSLGILEGNRQHRPGVLTENIIG